MLGWQCGRAAGPGGHRDPRLSRAGSAPRASAAVGAGSDATCARLNDQVYCWGASGSGQIGIGTPSDNSDGCINWCVLSPKQVLIDGTTPLAGVIDLHMGYLHVCAAREDHSLWCWGVGAGEFASALQTGNPTPAPVTNVALQTASGSGGLPTSLRYLTRDNRYLDGANEQPQVCP